MIYINSTGSITPQGRIENGHFVCVEPVYRELINPIQLRRMSRILKMGLGASAICINNLSDVKVDAIIVGTGMACIIDLEKFIASVINENEIMLSPIPFINSSHNTVAAQIAMNHKITGYNNTYCHRGASFEAALLDAMLLLSEGGANHVLVGGIDEYSQYHHSLMSEEHKMSNIMLGEGSIFFILEQQQRKDSIELNAVHTFLEFDDFNTNFIKSEIVDFLNKQNLKMSDIDIFVSGKNGNSITDNIYDELEKEFFQTSKIVYFKHLCGEYMTSTAFAIAMIANNLKLQKGKHILIYNHYNYINHSLILLTIEI